MPFETDDEYRARLQNSGVFGQAEAAQDVLSTGPVPDYSYLEQFGAALRENPVLTASRILFDQNQVFAPEPGFDPEPLLGNYATFAKQFPKLLEARSQAELAYRKTQIDREIRDREMLGQLGLIQGLPVYLSAGLLDPTNYIFLGTAAKAAGLVGKAALASRTASRSVLRSAARTGARTGLEAALSEAVVQSLLLEERPLLTTEEATMNVLGTGLFGSILGSAGGGIGGAKRKALYGLLGHESVGAARRAHAEVFIDAAREDPEFANALGLLQDSPAKFTFAEDDPMRGKILDVLEKKDPNLAKLLALDNRLGRIVTAPLIFSPAMRLARSKVQESRIVNQILTGHFHAENLPEGVGVSMEAIGEGLERSARAFVREATDIYERNRAIFGDIPESEVYEMAGFASRRDDKTAGRPVWRRGVDVDPFERLQTDDQRKVIGEIAKNFREFRDAIYRTADFVGATTSSPARRAAAKEILALLDGSLLNRVIDQEYAQANLPHLQEAARAGLLDRQKLKPEFKDKIEAFRSLADEAEDASDAAWYEDQARELESVMATLDDPTGRDFQNLVHSITDNLLPRASDTISAPQSAIRGRVLNIDERFLEEFYVNDVRALANRLIRSVLPDLMIADKVERTLGGKTPLVRRLGRDLRELDQRVEGAREFGVDDASAGEILVRAGDISDDAQAARLATELRLIRDSQAAGISNNLNVTMDEIHAATEVRKKERATRLRLRRDIEEFSGEAERRRAQIERLRTVFPELEEAQAGGKEAQARVRDLEKEQVVRLKQLDKQIAQTEKQLSDLNKQRDEKGLPEYVRVERRSEADFARGGADILSQSFERASGESKEAIARAEQIEAELPTMRHGRGAARREAKRLRAGAEIRRREGEVAAQRAAQIRSVASVSGQGSDLVPATKAIANLHHRLEVLKESRIIARTESDDLRAAREALEEQLATVDVVEEQALTAKRAIDGVKEKLQRLNDTIKGRRQEVNASHARAAMATRSLDRIARTIDQQVGARPGSQASRFDELRFRDNDFTLGDAATPEQIQRRLDAVNAIVHEQVSAARSSIFATNVGTEHFAALIERGTRRDNPGAAFTDSVQRTMRKEIRAMEAEILRMRNRHGIDTSDFASFGKAVRDINTSTRMGGLLLGALPDMAMAISTAGLGPYMQALGHALPIIMGKIPKNTGAELMYAMERTGGQIRAHKMLGVDDDIPTRGRFGRFAERARETVLNWSLIRRWNAVNKAIAWNALEHRVTKTLLSDNPTKQDVQMLRWFGIKDEDHADLRKVMRAAATSEAGTIGGNFYQANLDSWRPETGMDRLTGLSQDRLRNLRLTVNAAIGKGVNDTIITPSHGDLPPFATNHPLGRMLFQFRPFQFAVTQRFLVPALQRTIDGKLIGDPGPAATFVMASLIGSQVYMLHQWLKGEDPFAEKMDKDGNVESWQKRWILEGIDRAGSLGLLMEIVSGGEKVLGLGVGPTSRYASRDVIDSLLGPTVGLGQDLLGALGSLGREEFEAQDASRIRRLLPGQNLVILRALLDVGPNLPNAGTRRYFEDFLKAEERIAGFDPWEVN